MDKEIGLIIEDKKMDIIEGRWIHEGTIFSFIDDDPIVLIKNKE